MSEQTKSFSMPAVGVDSQMGLQSLINEPARLAREADLVNTELEALVMENYRIFVENLTCSVQLKREVRFSS
jgi:hypothetical protein